MAAAPRISHLSQPAVAAPNASDWNCIDAEFKAILSPIHLLSAGDITTDEAASIFSSLVNAHLDRFEVSGQSTNPQALTCRSRRIEKLAEDLRKVKNQSRKLLKQNPAHFHNINRVYSKVLKARDRLSSSQLLRRHEAAFRKNPWHYAKSTCDPKSQQEPTCSMESTYNYFSKSCATDDRYHRIPSWVEVVPVPDDDSLFKFDLSPVTPGLIKGILKSRSSGSSPGDDGISYHHLKKMTSTHHFLATLFSKILLESYSPPSSWCFARIKLIHKGGDTNCPANFRPIALTLAIGKLFNKIIASRLEEYLLENNIINPSLQKGFLRGINGTMEHIFSLSTIVDNARTNKLPLSLTFVDLRNAFGSVAHAYIKDIMSYVKLPTEVQFYVSALYANLSAYISTKQWKTQSFSIGRGVFQGDILSPLIWNRILDGRPAGQLSFLLRAGSDTLPTPLNLKRWRIRVDANCTLCGALSPTVLHILNGCPIALNQSRYT